MILTIRSGWDHPRGCGEHARRWWGNGASAGSSPRMRGALMSDKNDEKQPRIIPADAGSTSSHTSGLTAM